MNAATHHHPRRRPTAEERSFLEALIFWRSLYARRGSQDREPTVSLAICLAEAEQRLVAEQPAAVA